MTVSPTQRKTFKKKEAIRFRGHSRIRRFPLKSTRGEDHQGISDLGRNSPRRLWGWNPRCIRLRCEREVTNGVWTAFFKKPKWDEKEEIE